MLVDDQHRTGERARVAARSVLANVDCLDGLAADRRALVVGLAERLSRGHLDQRSTIGAVDELRDLLGPLPGLTARAVVSWLDDLSCACA